MAVYKNKKATKDGRQYFFRIKYKDIFGEYHDYSSSKFKTRKEAVDEEARYRIKIDNQEAFVSNITVKQAYEEYILEKSQKVKKQTIHKDEILFRYLKPIEDKKVNSIDVLMYKKFIKTIDKLDCSINYKNKILGLFIQIINYSKEYYNTSNSIISFIKKYENKNEIKKEMLFFTYDEYQQLDSVIDNHQFHTFFETLYFMGLRQGECQALTWKDIDFEKGTVSITKTLTTKIKGEKYTISSPKTKSSIRTLPLTQNLIEDLKTLKNEAMIFNDYSDNWFVFGKHIFPLPETTIQKAKNKYCKLAGVKQIRVHDFRHSCASLLINKGASVTLVSKWLGHSNVYITLNTYTHMFKNELIELTNILNNL